MIDTHVSADLHWRPAADVQDFAADEVAEDEVLDVFSRRLGRLN